MKIEETGLDGIGGEGALTALEEKELRDYFKQKKLGKITESQLKNPITDKKRATKKHKLLLTST